jgi:hypothetical protein
MYNDNSKNLDNLNNRDKLENFTPGALSKAKSIICLVSIAADGSMKKSSLLENKKEDFMLRPKVCEQVSDNTMIIYGEDDKKYKVGKITF